MLKRIFYLSVAILSLTLAYHFGAASAQSRTTTNSAVGLTSQGSGATFVALTAVGDVYRTDDVGTTWRFVGNIFGATTPTGP
jgi:hypothetical protein